MSSFGSMGSTITGGDFDDNFETERWLEGTEFGDLIEGLAGDDDLSGYGGDDTLIGGAGEDWLDGGDGADLLEGGPDDDFTLFGGSGTDTLDGGEGFDDASYAFDPAAVDVDLERGTAFDGHGFTDQIISIEAIFGSDYNDVLRGNDDYNVFTGHEGRDTIDGRGDDDFISHFRAPRGVVVDLANGTANDGWGSVDTLIDIEDAGGARDFSDTLRGSSDDNALYGYGGDDFMVGRAGDDFFRGDEGNDTIIGGPGQDEASYSRAPAGIDIDLKIGTGRDGEGSIDTFGGIEGIFGSNFDDRIAGDAQDNLLRGDEGADHLIGRQGDDTLVGGADVDTLDGGLGRDLANFQNDPVAIQVDLASGSFTGAAPDILLSIEDIEGTDYDDEIRGDALANSLFGDAGDDLLVGRRGRDSLIGGDGDDTLLGGRGADKLFASFGNDLIDGGLGINDLVFSRALRDVPLGAVTGTIDLATGRATNSDDDGSITLFNISNVLATRIEDDVALEMQVELRIIGNDLANRLVGGANNDTLSGGRGADSLEGAAGDDTLAGGPGADHFVFTRDWGTDRITDFGLAGAPETLVIDLAGEATNFDAFLNATTERFGDLIYDLGDDGANVIIFEDLRKSDLSAENFVFG